MPGRKDFSVSDLNHDHARSRNFRSTGFLLLGASGLCGLIAYEKYRSATVTAKKFSEAVGMEGVDFKATVPKETWIAGFFCVLLGVAALRCLAQWSRAVKTESVENPMLP